MSARGLGSAGAAPRHHVVTAIDRHQAPMTVVSRLAPGLIGCVLAGCSPPVVVPDPGLSLPATFTAADAVGGGEHGTERPMIEPTWWQTLGGAAGADLVAAALERNHDLQAAAARVVQALAETATSRADLVPTVDLSGEARRERRNFIGLPIPGREEQVLESISTSLLAGLTVSWEIDLWGRLRAATAAARAEEEAVALDLEAARLSLAGRTLSAWFAAGEARLQVELAAETTASLEATARAVRRRYESGLSPAVELRLALADARASAATLAARREELGARTRALEVLAGRYPAGTLAVATPLPDLPPLPAPGIPSELLVRRPDLRAAERRLAAAGARIDAARALLFPQIRLTASGGSASSDLENLIDSDFVVWGLASNLTQPIFHGGEIVAGIDLAEAREVELLARYRQSALDALAEVERLLDAGRWLEEQRTALGATVEHAVRAEALARERYLAGVGDLLTVLESERRAFDARRSLLELERRRLETRCDLHVALGGGFEPAPAEGS